MRVSVVLALTGALASSGCATLGSILSGTFQRPDLSLEGVEISGITPETLATKLAVRVRNPNDFAIEVAGLSYGFTLENNKLGNGRTDQKISIPADGSSTVVFPVELGIKEVIAAIGSLFQKDAIDYQVHLGVSFESPAGELEVPIDHVGSFPAPRPPVINIAGVKAGDVGIGGIDLQISLDVDNTNIFPLPSSALDYRLAIDGAQLASGKMQTPELEGQTKKTITIPLRVDFAQVAAGVASALTRGEGQFALGGSLDVAGSRLPLQTATAVSLR